MSAKQGPDAVCAKNAGREVKIETRLLDGGEDLLLQGSKDSLIFLSDLIKAVASSDSDSFQLGPKGAGGHFFKRTSSHGLYINRADAKPRRKKS